MALNAQINLTLVAHESSEGDLSSTLRATPVQHAVTLSDGTGENQAQVAWSGARTLSGGTDTLNLTSLNDLRAGATATVTMTAVKAVYVRNSGTASLSFAGGPFPSGGQTVAAGAVAIQVDPSQAGMTAGGVTVTGSSGLTYDILLIGEGSVA